MSMKKKVYIMRGISGSGKSTEVEKIRKEELQKLAIEEKVTVDQLENQGFVVVCSADQFFMRNGNYQYDYSKISDAHSMCLRNFVNALFDSKVKVIFVDNTHTETWEYAPYSALARAYDCEIIVVEVHRDIMLCIQDNKHAVPSHIIKAQFNRFQPTPLLYQTRVITIGELPSSLTRLVRRILRRV